MQYSSKIHVMVRKTEDWEKMRNYETELEFAPELLDFMGGNAFSINQKSFIIDGEWSCNEDELEGLVMEIADKLEDSCLIFASTTNINVDPYSYLVYYLGGDGVHGQYFDTENTPGYGRMWEFSFSANINSIIDCLNYCSRNHISFTKPELEYIKTFDIGICSDGDRIEFQENLHNLGLPDSVQLTGTQYEGRIARIENVSVGDMVTLLREPENEFDSNAIDVRNSEGSLGHLEAGACEILAPLLDKGIATYSAYVCSVTPLSKRSKRYKTALIEIHIDIKRKM